MKASVSILTGLLLFTSSLAMACNNDLICIGDVVYPETYAFSYGVVFDVNQAPGQVLVQQAGNYPDKLPVARVNIAVSYGCLEGVCVGDKVTANFIAPGVDQEVVGVNPYSKKLTIARAGAMYSQLWRGPAKDLFIREQTPQYGPAARAVPVYLKRK